MIPHRYPVRHCLFIVLLLGVCHVVAFSQNRQSLDNHIGLWTSSTSWDPAWANPDTIVNNASVEVYGYITSLSSLSFLGNVQSLVVNDTLVIQGDLILGSNISLIVADGGLLIIQGNLVLDNKTIVEANGCFIISGDIVKSSSVNQGTFSSNDNPARVFLGGTISSAGITGDNVNYPVLNQVNPVMIVYPGSHYPYGNMEDLANDPIFDFFRSTCSGVPDIPVVTASAAVTFCQGDSIMLHTGIYLRYFWSNGDTTATIWVNESGSYSLQVTNDDGCLSALSEPLEVTVIPKSPVAITSSPLPMCLSETRLLSGSPDGGSFSVLDGPGTLEGDFLIPLSTGTLRLAYTYSNVCVSQAEQTLVIQPQPVAVAGADQVLFFQTETEMQAELPEGQSGKWTRVSGSGDIVEPSSPSTLITNLTAGESIYRWTVRAGTCEDGQEVSIVVRDVLVPSVITPNGDGRNDFFRIDYPGRMKLTLFDQWGNLEYASDPYENNWEGKNSIGENLPADTYFYLLQFEKGMAKKGFVYIKR